jgi:DNA polymerase-1
MTARTTDTKKRLVLLDAHAIIHRAYHGMPDFTSSTGVPTGALYGLCTMLMRIVSDLKPDYVVACYDLPQKTFRHESYEAYKGTRGKTDDALIAQLQSSRDVFAAFHVPIYDAPGFEADDCLGTIVEQLKGKKDIEVIIASGDMDTLQLVSGKQVQVFTLKKGFNDTIMYDESKVIERFGFKPELLPDYKGLRGDTSDNIIGIAGIGEKTGMILVQTFGTIEKMYKVLAKDEAPFKEAGITPRIIELLKNGEDEALFSKTLATIRRDVPISFKLPEHMFREGIDLEKIEVLFRELEFRTLINRVKSNFTDATDAVADVQETKEFVEYDAEKVKQLSIALWLLNSELTNPTIDDILNFKKSKTFEEAEVNINQAIKDEELSYVYEHIELPLMRVIKQMEDNGILIDMPFFKKLGEEYHAQVKKLETAIWKHAGREFNINSSKQLGEILFDELNLAPASGKKLKKTTGGARSTRESELEKLREVHPIVDLILNYRELTKLLSTYIDTLPLLVKEDGRIHARFDQAGTTTGRFSSRDPNLQNIPVKTDVGKQIRYGFVAAPRHVLMSLDYSQIELRIAALLAGDEYLAQVFRDEKDVHSAVASRVFGVPENEVTHEMRRRAKVINFGILYGMGVTALQQNLGTTRAEAQEFYNNYFIQFPKIQAYLDSVIATAQKTKYTETLFGRKRYFPGLTSKIPFIRAMAERMAINAPIQGTATADVVKLGMISAEKALREAKLENKARLVLQVHDELVYEVDEDVKDQVEKIVIQAMEHAIPDEFLKGREYVPLRVSVGTGLSWGELK